MIIEIRKCGFENKGAQLMLLAIVQRLRRIAAGATLVMVPSGIGGPAPYADVARLGFHLKASLLRGGLELGHLATLVPKRLRRRYGLVLDREVDVVLDAAGFAYSDQWGTASCRELVRATRRWRRQGARVVLMPQAFGPFETPSNRAAIRRAVDDADLVFPRDAASYRYLTEVTGERESVRQCPDFTNLVEGVVPAWFDPTAHDTAIVPNHRMIRSTDAGTGARYVPFMARCATRLYERGAKPFLLVHEGPADQRLAQQISAAAGGIPVVTEVDPLQIKGILGACRCVIASRFHALVSALSQGVPALATSWSHKYGELFDDYGFPEGVLSTSDEDDRLDEMLDRLCDDACHREIAAQLEAASGRQKALSEAMWSDVRSVIEAGRSH